MKFCADRCTNNIRQFDVFIKGVLFQMQYFLFLGLKPKIAASDDLVKMSKNFVMVNTEVCL